MSTGGLSFTISSSKKITNVEKKCECWGQIWVVVQLICYRKSVIGGLERERVKKCETPLLQKAKRKENVEIVLC